MLLIKLVLNFLEPVTVIAITVVANATSYKTGLRLQVIA